MATAHIPYAGLARDTYARTSLTATYRPTAAFFIQRDQLMKKYHGEYFDNWSRDEKGFNLVSASKRRAIRCEPNRFVLRVEGGSSLQSFEELLSPMKDIVSTLQISEVAQVLFAITRVLPTKNLKQARTTFSENFMTSAALSLLKPGHTVDFATTIQRNWMANRQLEEVLGLTDPHTVLDMQENLTVGPVTRQEIAARFLEFKSDTPNELYIAEPSTPAFGIAGDMGFRAKRHTSTQVLESEVIWDVFSWAKKSADDTWEKIAGAR